MPLHLVKLCVGASSVDDLRAFQDARRAQAISEGRDPVQFHRTRMFPKRRDELLDGGSLYWVIKGVIQVRQTLLDIREHKGADGVRRCDLILRPTLTLTAHQPKRAFQGWRYLKDSETPRDLSDVGGAGDDLPPELRAELAELGLL